MLYRVTAWKGTLLPSWSAPGLGASYFVSCPTGYGPLALDFGHHPPRQAGRARFC